MLVTPLPGANRDHLLKTLREQHTAVSNLWSGHAGSAYGRITAYVEWVTNAVQHLANQITAADLNRLVLTPGYERLLVAAGNLTGADIGTQRALNALVGLELTQRVSEFEAAFKALQDHIQRWSDPGAYVVPDTSFYIEHPDKLEGADFATLHRLDFWPDAWIKVLVPIVVVDELDGLKRSKDRDTRWRAAYTLAKIDSLFVDASKPAVLKQPDADKQRGAVFMELVFDPPGHVRLPINDDEIVDRALAIQALAGMPVTLLTYDTGQSTRARSAGLKVNKLVKPIGDEPNK